MWSVPLNAMSAIATVPSGVPPFAAADTLNEYPPGAMFVNAKDVPVRTPPTVAASSETYASSEGRVRFTHRAAASPGPPFVKFARNTTAWPAVRVGVDPDAENDQLGCTKPYTRKGKSWRAVNHDSPSLEWRPVPPPYARSVPECQYE